MNSFGHFFCFNGQTAHTSPETNATQVVVAIGICLFSIEVFTYYKPYEDDFNDTVRHDENRLLPA